MKIVGKIFGWLFFVVGIVGTINYGIATICVFDPQIGVRIIDWISHYSPQIADYYGNIFLMNLFTGNSFTPIILLALSIGAIWLGHHLATLN
jgi:hypothetical protein